MKPLEPDPLPFRITAETFERALIAILPLMVICAGGVPGMRLMVLRVKVPPARVNVCAASTCNVCALKLPAPLRVTGPENCAPLVVESAEGAKFTASEPPVMFSVSRM